MSLKKILFFWGISLLLVSCTSKKSEPSATDYPIQPVEFTNVKLTDNFWLNRINTNRKVTIPFDFDKCDQTSRIANFAVAAGIAQGKFEGFRYNDSDVFKVMEGAAYSLHTYPDAELEQYLDSLINLIAHAQEPDGYLYTSRTINPALLPKGAGDTRWSNLKDSHELYNIGHMYEAAVAHFLATGKTNFLDVATKSADLICKTFGPAENQLHDVPGHQEIEIGLVKLYRVTHQEKYLAMAKYFLDQRGNSKNRTLYTHGENGSNKDYTQDHIPVIEQKEAVGHAVRAAYMYSGMADVAALTGNQDYINALDHLWNNVVGKKMYITGGIGSTYDGEAFGENYELPNLTAYCETCAAIANMLWNQRMFLLHGDAKYMDVFERTLYNNFLAGVSVNGNQFFYPNPLESDGSHERSPWFSCACCPTNVVRFLPSLPGYMVAHNNNNLYINLYASNKSTIPMPFGDLQLEQKANYPWSGEIEMLLTNIPKNSPMKLHLRIPGWARNQAVATDLYTFIETESQNISVKLNGEEISYTMNKGYAVIDRNWNPGDRIQLSLPMEIKRVLSSDSVENNRGKMAIQVGPLVYAAEGVDHNDKVVNLLLDKDISLAFETNNNWIDGMKTLVGKGLAVSKNESGEILKSETDLTLIPYFAWDHRGPNEMLIWFPYNESASSPAPPPSLASRSKASASYIYDQLRAVNDQVDPKNSADETIPRLTFRDKKGTEEWVVYEFPEKANISRAAIYWFDDGPNGGCRIPASWRLQYRDQKILEWKNVTIYNDYTIKINEFNSVTFMPVTTNAVRLMVQLQQDYSGGILEWKIQ